jgi:hypothetical protein
MASTEYPEQALEDSGHTGDSGIAATAAPDTAAADRKSVV